ncbi:hypothetical protein OUZ56_025483 [Daphnia magna]|uniref:Uncharacterized protein n=1 Tax=Daphnia magna TaxID=35525 RepID=A0ABQ9ZJZ2_9CRUS|nr:hypothetical protein OUZ56_025483 [Daphnia magna]
MSGHEAYLEVLNSQTPLTLSYGNLGNQRRRNSRTATSPSGINNVLADARTKLFSSWRDGSTQGFLFYTKPTQKRQPNNFWFIGPDAENFRDSTGWDDGNGGGLRSIIEKLFCGWKAKPTLDITGETVDVLDHISITNAASIAVERAESLAAKNLLSKQKQPGWSTMSATERVAAVSKRYLKKKTRLAQMDTSIREHHSPDPGLSHFQDLPSTSGSFSVYPSPSKSSTPDAISPQLTRSSSSVNYARTTSKSPFKVTQLAGVGENQLEDMGATKRRLFMPCQSDRPSVLTYSDHRIERSSIRVQLSPKSNLFFAVVVMAILETHKKQTNISKIITAVQTARRFHAAQYQKYLNTDDEANDEDVGGEGERPRVDVQTISEIESRVNQILKSLEVYSDTQA